MEDHDIIGVSGRETGTSFPPRELAGKHPAGQFRTVLAITTKSRFRFQMEGVGSYILPNAGQGKRLPPPLSKDLMASLEHVRARCCSRGAGRYRKSPRSDRGPRFPIAGTARFLVFMRRKVSTIV